MRIVLPLLIAASCARTTTSHAVRDAPPPGATPFAAPAPPPDPALGDAPPLRDLLRLALARNPRIAASRQRALAAAETPAIEAALPDPMLMLGWYETSVQTRVGPQEFSLGIQQRVPWPSKLTARAELGRTDARRAAVAYERAVRDVLVEVTQSAHEIAYLDEASAIAARIGALLERYAAAAAAGETGSPVNELFRAETQRAQLDHDRVLLEEMRAAESERLRALLDLPPDAPVGTPRADPVPRLAASWSELLARATAHNQELLEAGIAVEAAGWQTRLARKERLPDLTLGFTRIYTDGLATNPVGNGEDPRIFTLGLNLPVWENRNRARIRKAEAQERAAALDRDAVYQQLRTRLARTWYRVGNAGRLARLYGDVLVPRAATAARSAEDLQAAGKGTLAGTLETIAVLYNFRLAHARARADHAQAVAELEGILGEPFTLAEGDGQ